MSAAVEIVAVVASVATGGWALVKAGPFGWRVVKVFARAPFIIEGVAREFSPNGGGSMRDQLNDLQKFAEYQHAVNHNTGNALSRVEGKLARVDERLEKLIDHLGGDE